MKKVKIIQLYKDSFSGISKEVWLLSLVTLINRTGSMVLPFLSLYLTTVEGYSLSTAGLILLFFGVGSFFGNYYGGVLSDKIGPFRLQFLSLLTSAFALLSLLFLHTPVSMAIGLFVASLLMDAFRPANMASIGILEPKENRTKAIGVIRLAINLGFAAGPASGGLIAFAIGYDWLFIIDASTCFLAAFFLLFLFLKQIKAEGQKKPENKAEEKPNIRLVLKDKIFLRFLFYMFLTACVFMQLFHTVPIFFKQRLLLDEDIIGLLMAMNGVLVVFLELPLIHILQKRSILKLIAWGCFLIGLCYAVLYFESWKGVAVLCLLFFSIGEILALPFTTTAVINRAPEQLRGRYLALYGMAFSICHMIAPVVGLRSVDIFGFPVFWLSIAVLICLAGIGFWRLHHRFTND